MKVGASNGVTPEFKKSWPGGGGSGQPENPLETPLYTVLLSLHGHVVRGHSSVT